MRRDQPDETVLFPPVFLRIFQFTVIALHLPEHLDMLVVAGIIYFFFGEKMIYYQGSTLPNHKNSGAMTKIICESVRLFGGKYRFLDFYGSMIEPIERFFRGFGAVPVRYGQFTLDRLPVWASVARKFISAGKRRK